MSVSSTKLIEGMAFEIQSSGFSVKTDVPEKLGGKNSNPDPHDYLEIALAGCTAITVQMYAKRKNIPLEYTNVAVKIISEGATNEILREIEFVGSLSDQEKQALFVIAEKCPIHKILSSGAKITSRMF